MKTKLFFHSRAQQVNDKECVLYSDLMSIIFFAGVNEQILSRNQDPKNVHIKWRNFSQRMRAVHSVHFYDFDENHQLHPGPGHLHAVTE